MPMIDVFAPGPLLAEEADGQLATELTWAVVRAEGVDAPSAFHLDNTAAFIHRLPTESISTGSASGAHAVRVQIVTPPGALSRAGQRQITSEATALIAGAVTVGERVKTWVIITEAAEGGWGIDGTAFGVKEFTALGGAPSGE